MLWSRRHFLRISSLCTIAAAVPVAATKAVLVAASDFDGIYRSLDPVVVTKLRGPKITVELLRETADDMLKNR